MRWLRAAMAEPFGLVVQDGFVAASACLGLGAAWLLSREPLLGPVAGAGFGLFAFLALALLLSLRRVGRR